MTGGFGFGFVDGTGTAGFLAVCGCGGFGLADGIGTAGFGFEATMGGG